MGKVYILTNDFMPGIVKIGYTTQSIEKRLRELDDTGVPWPFKCHFAIETDRYKEIELLLHDAFANCRVRENREFFQIEPERVVSALRISGGTEIMTDNEAIDHDGRKAEVPRMARNGAKRFQFEKYGINIGSELSFTRDKQKKCKVIDNGDVEYQGENQLVPIFFVILFVEIISYTYMKLTKKEFF